MSLSLPQMGWSNFYQQQLTLDEWGSVTPARVIEQHRSRLLLWTESGEINMTLAAPLSPQTPLNTLPPLTVGDWLLLDSEHRVVRLLERLSLFSRKAAGSKVAEQLIAANIDTLFIVCSLNSDFNLNRIERYLALAHEAGVEPVVVLSKSDLCDHSDERLRQVQDLDPMLAVEAINGLDSSSANKLQPWCKSGKTLALLGSSGAGKSTLTNTLLDQQQLATGDIREDDSKGRHTTTGRSLHPAPSGALILDTPGMRELQLFDSETGVAHTFADITELAQQCRFSDCQHQSEPGCAIQSALNSGVLDERRLLNYQKLMREQAFNSASLSEKRARDKNTTRYQQTVQSQSRNLKGKR